MMFSQDCNVKQSKQNDFPAGKGIALPNGGRKPGLFSKEESEAFRIAGSSEFCERKVATFAGEGEAAFSNFHCNAFLCSEIGDPACWELALQ